MTEEIKKEKKEVVLPEERESGSHTDSKDTKNNEESQKQKQDYEALLNKVKVLEKQVQDKESMIGRQSNEIGAMRETLKEMKENKEKPQSERMTNTELIEKAADRLMKADPTLKRDDAEYNAKLIVEGNMAIREIEKTDYEKNRVKAMKEELADMVDDAIEDGILDAKAIEECKEDIMKEFNSRKLRNTSRANFRMFKECYKLVTKRKADEMKEENKSEDEKKRDAEISSSSVDTTKSGDKKGTDEDKAERKKIMGAGKPSNNVFF